MRAHRGQSVPESVRGRPGETFPAPGGGGSGAAAELRPPPRHSPDIACAQSERRRRIDRPPTEHFFPNPAEEASVVPSEFACYCASRMALTCWEKIAVVVIAAVGLRLAVRISLTLWKKLIAPSLGLGIDVASQGKWAVVTGATDGLGKAFAQALANKGLDIVLVSRSLQKLEDVSAEIKQKYGVETRIVEADLTEGQTVYNKIGKAIEELEVGVLVNNAGASYDHPELFTHVSEEAIARILQLNVAAVTGVARQVLPGMMERRKGVIINIGSAAGAMPSPYLAVYSASKMFIDKLSADLAAEAAPRGVTVQVVLPGPVATKMSKIKRATWMAPTPERFVEASLRTVGIEQRTTGYPPHSLILGFMNGLTCVCEKAAVWLVARTMLNIRGRALRKKMKEEAAASVKDTDDTASIEH